MCDEQEALLPAASELGKARFDRHSSGFGRAHLGRKHMREIIEFRQDGDRREIRPGHSVFELQSASEIVSVEPPAPRKSAPLYSTA